MKLKIPGDASQITLQQFMDYHGAADDCERVMVIINKSREYCEQLKAETVHTIVTLFDEVIDSSSSNFERIISVNGKRLGFIPDINGMTFREHVDLDQLSKSIWLTNGKTDYTNLAQLMAILYRPIKEQVGQYYNLVKYDSDGVKKYLPAINGLTMDRVQGGLLFFSSIGAELVNNSLHYLDGILAKEMRTIIPPTVSPDGGGITYSNQ